MIIASFHPNILGYSSSINPSAANTMAVNIVKTVEAQKSNVVLPVSIQPTAWRVEIDEFLADTKMTNLFLLALQKDGLGMLDAKELETKEAGLGPLQAKDKVNWWTFYNLSGRFTVAMLYTQNLDSGRQSQQPPRGLERRHNQDANRV